MIRHKLHTDEFWSGDNGLREIDLTVEPTSEDIRPGSGDGWKTLWDSDFDIGDQQRWEQFVDGDTANRREVAWLLGV